MQQSSNSRCYYSILLGKWYYNKTTLPDGSWRSSTSSYNHHTAIVKAVSGSQIYLLQQNVGDSGKGPDAKKIVQSGTINLNDVTGGSMWIYRPTLYNWQDEQVLRDRTCLYFVVDSTLPLLYVGEIARSHKQRWQNHPARSLHSALH